ncbi:histidine kinase [Streptomyces sp. NPDC006283]|uniref:sensor histidine kinase n=1 Tax=Streptomyces sp. NPDC006283 TaxID=3156741 RepID=UPI0033A34293
MWSRRRIVGEILLSTVLALLAAAAEALPEPLSGVGVIWIVTAGLAAALLSVLRRSFPATVLLVTAASLAEFSVLYLLLPVTAWSAGRRIDGISKAVGIFAAAYALAFGLPLLRLRPPLPTALSLAALLLVLMVIPALTSYYWAQRGALIDLLRAYDAHLLRERTMIAEQARMRERQRIAQDMHDSLGHQLTLISVHLGALEVNRDLTRQQRQALRVLREVSVATMQELREVVGLLRDNGTDHPGPKAAVSSALAAIESKHPPAPLRGAAGIENLVNASRSAGMTIELRHRGEPRPLPAAADHAAYRIAQEGLTNAHKHAPTAPITIELRYEPDALVTEVANGPAPQTTHCDRSVVSGGQGLTGLRERTRLIGGTLNAGSTADGGFRLAGRLPYIPPSLSPEDPPTTPVDPVSDPREQPTAVPAGGSIPFTDGNGLPKELTRAISGLTNRRGAAIGCGVAGAVLLLTTMIFSLQSEPPPAIDPGQYDAMEVGQSETEVRANLPHGYSGLNYSVDESTPPEPNNEAECLTLLSTEPGSSRSNAPVFRFCFKDGKMIEKRSFEINLFNLNLSRSGGW